jgi:hypothetical protein
VINAGSGGGILQLTPEIPLLFRDKSKKKQFVSMYLL